jgi:predicted RNA-binding protein
VLLHDCIIGYEQSFEFGYCNASTSLWFEGMINLNINKTELAVMCELKVILKGKTIMEDVVRITADKGSIKLQGVLGETKTIHGRIVDINLTKKEAIIGE